MTDRDAGRKKKDVMSFVVDAGRTVICPECYVHNRLDSPVKEGQVILCYACRVRIKIVSEGGTLTAEVLPDEKGEEDKSW